MREQTVFVIAAQIAAHLNIATKIAQDLSLTAKNARAITVRAGQQAVGFTAITAFIQELATTTIYLAKEINSTAIKISMQATEIERVKQGLQQFAQVEILAVDTPHLASVRPFILKNKQTFQALNQDFKSLQRLLNDLIGESQKQIRSAAVISSLSKIEASKSGDFQHQLEVIAANIHLAANDIKSELYAAEKLLNKTKS